MAATRATCIGYDSNREKSDTRLGSRAAEGRAATWSTFASAYVDRDGSGYVEVRRGADTWRATFNAETDTLRVHVEKVYDNPGSEKSTFTETWPRPMTVWKP